MLREQHSYLVFAHGETEAAGLVRYLGLAQGQLVHLLGVAACNGRGRECQTRLPKSCSKLC